MSAHTKWPDFQLASKLRYLIGSQSGGPEGIMFPEKTSSPLLGRSERGLPSPDHDAHDSGTDERIDMMADIGDRPLDEMDGLGSFDADADADFGDLEMFDSNASQALFSSQAPQSIKSEGPVFPTPTGGAKRDKKKKEKGDSRYSHSAADAETSSAKRKKSKRKSLQEADIANGSLAHQDSIPRPATEPNEASAEASAIASGMPAQEPATVPSTQTKKKRKLSNSAEGKRRKKRKSGDHNDDVVRETQEDAHRPGSRDAFLRMDKSAGDASLGAIYEDDTATSDRQTSPSVARLRRRSQSREARSRENSVPPFRAEIARMGIDGLPRDARHEQVLADDAMETDKAGENQTNELSPDDAAAEAVDAEPDVESLARQAWHEHITNQNDENDDMADVHQPPQNDTPSTNEAAESSARPEESSELSPKRRRSARTKKSKPTLFEQAAAAESPAKKSRRGVVEELPPSSADAPKPKAKAKRASKKSKVLEAMPEELSQSMQCDLPKKKAEDQCGAEDADADADADVDADVDAEADEEPLARRSQLGGYTQGRFTDQELARITRAVESFRVANELTQFQVNEMIQAPGGTTAGDAHAQLWARLVAECPDRKRQKVINVTRKNFHNFVARGTWTLEQDAELGALIDVNGTAWSKIAAIINRHPEDVRDRFRNYIVCGANQRKDTWDEEEQERLTEHVKEAMETIDELRNSAPNQMLMKPYEELIDWQNISEKMERTRSRLQCITKWKAMQERASGKKKPKKSRDSESKSRSSELKSGTAEPQQIESDEQISSHLETARQQLASMREEEQYRLVLAINTASVTSDGSIPWSKLLDKKFHSQWDRATQVLLWDRLKQTVPDWESKPAQELAQQIINEYNRTGGMPEVTGSGYDDDEREMELLKQAHSRGTTNGTSHKERQHKSAEFVENSDVEENGDTQLKDQAGSDEMNIDPALTHEPPAASKATPAKKTASKRQSSAKKRPKKAARASKDPIEDSEPVMTLPPVDEGEDSNIDEEQFRKKKTPSKFKELNGKSTEDTIVPQPEPASDSDMGDMEDLPAKIAA